MKRGKMSMSILTGVVLALGGASGLQADPVNIATVPVGQVGNSGELSGIGAGGSGPDAIVGGVNYAYNIGQFEVTAGQYTEFLNAVAAADDYQLYETTMWTYFYGCRIQRSGGWGSYTYSVAADWADRPVNEVSWADAARFANWMHNGQPTGAQGPGTTEDGSYALNGVMSNVDVMGVVRKPDATWVIPSEDEWYKAAYHKNDGVTGNYWEYPMGSSAVPDNGNPGGDSGNSANFYDGDYAIGGLYTRTEAGYFGLSDSPYGTFDQGGNVYEWTEAVIGSGRGMRGGSAGAGGSKLHAATRESHTPGIAADSIGFRLVEVPEPATLTLLAFGGLALLRRRR